MRDRSDFRGGCLTTIIAPDGTFIGEPLREGEGEVIADLDFQLIDKRKMSMDSHGPAAGPNCSAC